MEDIKATLEKIDSKIDRLDTRLDKLEISQVIISKDLQYHIKRTNILEDSLKPIKQKYDQAKGVLKFCGAVAGMVGVIEAVVRVFYQ